MQHLTKLQNVKGSYSNSNTGSFAHDLKLLITKPCCLNEFKKKKGLG